MKHINENEIDRTINFINEYDEIYCDADELGICCGNCEGCRNHSHFYPIDD